MAAIIDTASKIVNKHGAGVHGFDAGDPVVGRSATELSPDWCDGVQQEINNAVTVAPAVLDNTNRTQLGQSIDAQNRDRYPRYAGTTTFTERTQGDTAMSGNSAAWLRRIRTDFKSNVATNAIYTALAMTLPTASQANMMLRASVVQVNANLATNYANVIIVGSATRSAAGVYTVQTSTAILQDIPLAGLVIVPSISGGICLRITIPNVVGATWNIFASGVIENVTQ